jgi:PAS domain S-box-containing protein
MSSRILIIDDDPNAADRLEHLLRGYPCEVITAANGEDALLQLQQKILALEATIQKLQTTETLIKAINDNLPDGMIYRVIINSDGTRQFTYVSDSVRKLHGVSPEEVLADASLMYSKIHEHDIQLLIKAENEALKNKSTFQMDVRVKEPSGKIRWSSLTSTPRIMEDGTVCWDGIERVITERKEMELALRASEERYKSLVDKVPDIVFTLDLDLKTTYVSPSIQNILGFSIKERLEQTIDQQLTPASFAIALDTMARELALEKEGQSDPQRKIILELEFYHKDGSTRWTETIISGLRNEKGELTGIHGVLRDITAKKQAEENLRERYKELNCLYSIADIIAKTEPLDDLLQQITNQIPPGFYFSDQASARIVLKQKEFKTANFQETAWKLSAKLLIEGNSAGAVEVCYPDKMPDKGKGPFLDEEQSLLLAIAEHLGRVIERKKMEQDRERLISELQKALSEIRTLSGLIPICAACKKIRDDKGYWNQLELYLTDHSDAEFSHSICPECREKLYPEIKVEHQMKQAGKTVILVVDDEDDFRMLFIRQIRRMMKDHGLEFVEAGNGEEALELLKTGLKPSMIFIDYIMPRVDGLELLRRINDDYPDLYDVPCVMVSGYRREDVISEAEKMSCAFFDKNLDQKSFYEQIGRHLTTKLGLA